MPDMNGIMCSYDNFPMYGLASYIQSQWIVALTMASQVAVDMGDIQADADATIKYDHIDKIEYLDNYIIQMFIPNKFND